VISHDNAVASIERILLSLEEVVRVEEVDALLPSLPCLLVAFEFWIIRDENPRLDIFAFSQSV
jgi:hypothetical protein